MYCALPNKSVSAGVSVSTFLFSRAHVALAPWICFRLAMQAFFWLAVRAFTKFGIAIAAKRPIMATTIMISTSVKPAFRWVLLFIYCFLPFCRGVNINRRRFTNIAAHRSQIAFRQPHLHTSNGYAMARSDDRAAT